MNNMQELVSVIIPVYNVKDYLDICLKSVSDQTYRNLEILVVDDGSFDGSGERCDFWKKKDPRIVVVHQANHGVSAARNAGIEMANGQYLTFVDADDWLDVRAIEKLVHHMEAHQADAVVCGAVIESLGPQFNNCKGFPTEDCDFENAIIHVIRRTTGIYGLLINRDSIFVDNGYIAMMPDLSYGEDEVWIYEVFQNCSTISFLPESLYYWRNRESSITKEKRVTEKTLSLIEAKKRALQVLPQIEKVQTMAKAHAYYALFTLKVFAYCEPNVQVMHVIHAALEELELKKYWKQSKEITLTMKAKNELLTILMRMKASRKMVDFVFNIR